MTDEAAFLAAIAERPGDPTPRLVYADWLDDRCDPRAELIRIEEEQRTLPADADRYWALKPRRDELRAGCSADWLAALGSGTVYRPVLAPWPTAGVRGRFRLLRELVERWYGEPMPDAGGRADEVAAIEARVGRPLPAAVREWIAFALDVGGSPAAREVFRSGIYDLRVEYDPHLAVVSLLEDVVEGDYLWAVPADRLADPDPPVVLDYMGQPAGGNPFRTATVFAFEFVSTYLAGGGNTYGDPAWVARARRAADECFPARVMIGHVTAYEAEGVLATCGVMGHPGPDQQRLGARVRGPIPDPAVAAWVAGLR